MRAILLVGLVLPVFYAGAQTALFIPDTLAGPNINLTIHKDSVQFFPAGSKSYTYAYNQYAYLGPTLIFQKGQHLDITVNNALDDTTTIHWHGIHLPAGSDGGPHSEIMPGSTWNPQFTVMDKAATYWYHPHTHMKTASQAIKGAVGFILVRDQHEATLNLPRTYGVDDFPIVIQSQQYDSNNQAMPLGMEDSTILVNGARANDGYSVEASFPAQMVRLRILNGSGERALNVGFTNDKSFYQIASDGGLLNQPFDTTRVRLSPGERAELILDLSGMQGQSLYLMSVASELPMGIQGGATMPMPPGSPPMNSPLNGVDFNILKINVAAPTATPVTTIPAVLENNVPYSLADVDEYRTIRFTADSEMVMDGPFYFNDSSFNMDRIDFVIPINHTEVWKLVNETMVAHPFHIHDVQFYLLDRGGLVPHAGERGRKDVVLVPSGDSVQFITKFEDYADTVMPYMYHCHILMHEDDGMMGQFLVVPPEYLALNEHFVKTKALTIYPNPVEDVLHLVLPEKDKKYDLRILNNAGQVILKWNNVTENTWDVSGLQPGNYSVLIRVGNQYYNTQLVKR